MLDYKVKHFHCPKHTFQPILSVSEDPLVTGGILYCYMCQAELSKEQKGFLVSLEDFILNSVAELSSAETIKFKIRPPKELTSDFRAIERKIEEFAMNINSEKNKIANKLSKIQNDFISTLGKIKGKLLYELDAQVRYIKETYQDFRDMIRRHFEQDDNVYRRITVDDLFNEVNSCATAEELMYIIRRRMNQVEECKVYFRENMKPELAISRLSGLKQDILAMLEKKPRSPFYNENYFREIHQAIVTQTETILAGIGQLEDCIDIDRSSLLGSAILSLTKFLDIRQTLWKGKVSDVHLVKKSSKSGANMEELVELYNKMENSMMILRDSAESTSIICYKEGRMISGDHRNIAIVLNQEKGDVVVQATDMPFSDEIKSYLTRDVCLRLKNKKNIEEFKNRLNINGIKIHKAACFAEVSLGSKNKKYYVIKEAELFQVKLF